MILQSPLLPLNHAQRECCFLATKSKKYCHRGKHIHVSTPLVIIVLSLMKSSTEASSKFASGTASSAGLDLLFAASQLTSSPADADQVAHHRPSMPVINGPYDYPRQRDITATRINQEEVSAPSSISSEGGNSQPLVAEPNSTKSFVQVLMDILNVTDPDHTDVICWVPDGESFLIADQERFERELLPTYFRGSLFNSFVRKLNRWGFRRLKRTGKASSFAHDCFLRDKPWLCENMRCQSKPNFKKVSLKIKGCVRQTGLAPVSPGDAAVQQHDVQVPPSLPPSDSTSYSKNNVNQSLLFSPTLAITNIPQPPPPLPPSSVSSSAANIMEEQRLKRELLFAPMSQMQHRPQLQMNQMQYLNTMNALTHEELAQLRYLQSSSVSQYTRDMLRRNNTKPP